MGLLTKLNEFRRKLTYEKGLLVSVFSGGLMLLFLIWAFQIIILVFSPAIGFEAIGFLFIPILPALLFVKNPDVTTAYVVAYLIWLLVGCGVNLILYYKGNNIQPKQ
jgi:hypothetical protein